MLALRRFVVRLGQLAAGAGAVLGAGDESTAGQVEASCLQRRQAVAHRRKRDEQQQKDGRAPVGGHAGPASYALRSTGRAVRRGHFSTGSRLPADEGNLVDVDTSPRAGALPRLEIGTWEETVHRRGSIRRSGPRARALVLLAVSAWLTLAGGAAVSTQAAQAAGSPTAISTSQFVNQFDAEPYVGNGYFSQRIPAAGTGLPRGRHDRVAARDAAVH